MNDAYCEVENTDPSIHLKWIEKHGFQLNEDGSFKIDSFEGQTPVGEEKLIENIKINVSAGGYEPIYSKPYDERTFVMVCGGPSLARYLDEIRRKVSKPEEYLVVCSNRTAAYLRLNEITPHVHFIIDPQAKKQFDVEGAIPETQYWINAACDPSVFNSLKAQGIKPCMFLADFEAEGRAREAVKQSMAPGQPGMMAIQGGTMAGLRAMNLAEAMGHRKMQYYGFDAAVEVGDGVARPYAYEKKRGEVIIEVTCDKCGESFNSTLILQRQVNEFLEWSRRMPWVEVEIIGGGLIAHCQKHQKDLETKKAVSKHRYTPYYAELQKELHSRGNYGVAGVSFIPTIFHGIAQLHKRLGEVAVLDYGSSTGGTMRAVREHMSLWPTVTDTCYDPFVERFSVEPKPADFVICTDVMEHVEPECTSAVLDHIQSLTKRIVFFSISLRPANKELQDGRNAHINLRDSEFWLVEVQKRFIISEAKVGSDGENLLVIAQAIDDVKELMRARRSYH